MFANSAIVVFGALRVKNVAILLYSQQKKQNTDLYFCF